MWERRLVHENRPFTRFRPVDLWTEENAQQIRRLASKSGNYVHRLERLPLEERMMAVERSGGNSQGQRDSLVYLTTSST